MASEFEYSCQCLPGYKGRKCENKGLENDSLYNLRMTHLLYHVTHAAWVIEMTSMDNDVDGLPRLTVISFSAPIFRIINIEKITNECFFDTSGADFRTGSGTGS